MDEVADEILKAERQAYKKVIRMMSHEVNNSVGAVNSILDYNLEFKSQLNKDDQEDFESSLKVAIERNDNLMIFMKNYSKAIKLPQPILEKNNIHDLLLTVYMLMNSECQKRMVKWQWELIKSDLIVEIDTQLIEQVLVNIIKNSIEAIGKYGKITIITKTDPQKALIVRDDGNGIDSEDKKYLFSPFFSTKKNGQGIGLTLTREILNLHNFKFTLTTKGEYTDFTILFD